MAKPKRKHLHIGGIILVLILLGLTGFGLWFSQHYKAMLKKQIPVWVAKGTDSLYKISLDEVNINIYTRRVTVTGVKVWLDTNQLARLRAEGRSPHVFYTANIPVIQVKGIAWEDMAADKQLRCKSLVVLNPELRITKFPETTADSLHRVNDSLAKAYEDKKPSIEGVYVGQIIVTHPHVTYGSTDTAGRTSTLALDDGKLILNDFEIDPTKPKDSSRFFYAKTAIISIDSLAYKKDKFLYSVRANNIRLNTDSNTLSLTNFAMKGNVSKDDFYRITGHQNDLFTMSFPSVAIDGFDWKRLLNNKIIAIEAITLQNPVLEDYFTRLAPGNQLSKKGKYPNQLISRMKQKLDIRSIKIRNGHFKYTEVNEKTRMAGVLRFDGINGTVSNATNLPEQVAKSSACIIKLNGQFMGKSPINAAFNLSLSDPGGAFTVDGGLKDLDASQINGVAKALAVTEIQSVHISKLDLHVTGDESHGQGTVTMLYTNLKVVPQKVDSNNKLKDNSFLSFLTNTLIIYSDNPMNGKPVRTESAYVARDEHKSFFNLIWKSIFNCVQKTAIRSDNIEKTLEDKQNKKDAKKGFLKRLFGGKKDKAKDDKKDDKKKDDKKKDKK